MRKQKQTSRRLRARAPVVASPEPSAAGKPAQAEPARAEEAGPSVTRDCVARAHRLAHGLALRSYPAAADPDLVARLDREALLFLVSQVSRLYQACVDRCRKAVEAATAARDKAWPKKRSGLEKAFSVLGADYDRKVDAAFRAAWERELVSQELVRSVKIETPIFQENLRPFIEAADRVSHPSAPFPAWLKEPLGCIAVALQTDDLQASVLRTFRTESTLLPDFAMPAGASTGKEPAQGHPRTQIHPAWVHAVRQVVSVLTEERGLSDRDACGLVSAVLRANEVAPPSRSADARRRFVQELLA